MAAPTDSYCEEPGCGLPSVPTGAPYLAGRATDGPAGFVPVYFQRWECFGGHHYGTEVPNYRPPRVGGFGDILYSCPNDECEVTSVHVGHGIAAECPECGWTLTNGTEE